MGSIGRNDPCHCGSGKKYKKCCLMVEEARMLAEREERERRIAQEEKARMVRDGWMVSDDSDFELVDEKEDLPSGGKAAAAADAADEDAVDDVAEDWWVEFLDGFSEVEDVGERIAELRRAVMEAPVVFPEDFSPLVVEVQDAIEDPSHAQLLMNVLQEYETRHPKIYAEEEWWVNMQRFKLAASMGVGDLGKLAVANAPLMGNDPRSFFIQVLELLAWRGEHSSLVETLVAAWAHRKGTGDQDGDDVGTPLTGVALNLALGMTHDTDLYPQLAQVARDSANASGEYPDALLAMWEAGYNDDSSELQKYPSLAAIRRWLRSTRGDPLNPLNGWPWSRLVLAAGIWAVVFPPDDIQVPSGGADWVELPFKVLLPLRSAAAIKYLFESRQISDHAVGAWASSVPSWIQRHMADPVPDAIRTAFLEQVQEAVALLRDELPRAGEVRQAVADSLAWLEQWAIPTGIPVKGHEDLYMADDDVRQLMSCGEAVPPDLWGRLVARGADVAPMLHGVIHDAWLDEFDEELVPGGSRFLGAQHACFILAAMGNPASAVHLVKTAKVFSDSDWLYEGMVWFPTALGPESADVFLRFAMDCAVRWYPRAGAAKGLVWLAGEFPELRERVVTCLISILESPLEHSDSISQLVGPLCATGDERAIEALKRAYARGDINRWMAGTLDEAIAGQRGDWYRSDPPIHTTTHEYFMQIARYGKSNKRPSGPPPKWQQQREATLKRKKNKKKRR